MIPLEQCVARPPEGGRDYPLISHLIEVAERSGNPQGDPFEQLQFLAGLLHDAGKAQSSWQRYIAVPAQRRGSVPHAFLGAALFFVFALRLRNEYRQLCAHNAELLDGAILQLTADLADHHGELKDLDEAAPPWEAGWRPGCLEETDLAGLLRFVREHFPPLEAGGIVSPEDIPELIRQARMQWRRLVIAHQSRRVESADEAGDDVVVKRLRTARLISADRFSVAQVTPVALSPQQADAALERLLGYCRQRGDELGAREKTTLTGLRQRAQEEVVRAYQAAPSSAFYTLRMPTGMGKTLAALRVGLEACRTGRAERIVYVAPYLTILSQAVKEMREATELEVIEHHHLSVLQPSSGEEGDPHELLLQESWQAPIVATTFNQLFRALSPRSAQETIRLHAMQKAFFILDEPQIVDGDVWRLFLSLMEAAAARLRMTALLITATTPPLDALRVAPVDLTPQALPSPCRYVVTVRREQMDEHALADALVEAVEERRVVAAILNTIEDAGRVYKQVKQRCGPQVAVFNLHGAMTSLHKKERIEQIRARLNAKQPTVVVATQIIEAGVDLSFRLIYRARPIVPSLVQAAGRANRHAAEGEPLAEVVDFHFLRDGKETRQYVYDGIATDVSDELLASFDSIPEPEMLALCERYFEEVFRRKPGTSTLAYLKEATLGRWSNLQRISPFQEKGYRISVFVPNEGPWVDGDTRKLLAYFGARDPGHLYELYRERRWISQLSFVDRKRFFGLMQRFIVPVPYRHARVITNLGEVSASEQPPAIALLRQPQLYREDTGFGNLVQDVDEWIYHH